MGVWAINVYNDATLRKTCVSTVMARTRLDTARDDVGKGILKFFV